MDQNITPGTTQLSDKPAPAATPVKAAKPAAKPLPELTPEQQEHLALGIRAAADQKRLKELNDKLFGPSTPVPPPKKAKTANQETLEKMQGSATAPAIENSIEPTGKTRARGPGQEEQEQETPAPIGRASYTLPLGAASVPLDSQSFGSTNFIPPAKPVDLSKRDKAASAPLQDDPMAIPAHVKARYLLVKGNEYWRDKGDKTPVFIDHGIKLATKEHNGQVITDLVAIATARNWGSITAKGSREFRQAMWEKGNAAGLDVKGYTPSAVEKAAMDQYLASHPRSATPDNTVEKTAKAKEVQRPAQSAALSPAPSAITKPEKEDTRTQAQKHQAAKADANIAPAWGDETKAPPAKTAPPAKIEAAAKTIPPLPEKFTPTKNTIGKLIAHGDADYLHDPKNERSYVVKVETPDNKQVEVWGVGLKAAMAKASVFIGENIALTRGAADPVTAKAKEYDKEGKVIGKQDVAARRNQWHVGSLDKAAAFATAVNNGKLADAVKADPALLPGAMLVKMATQFARQKIADPAHRQQFIDNARAEATQGLATGKTIATPRRKETPVKAQSLQADKQLERTR